MKIVLTLITPILLILSQGNAQTDSNIRSSHTSSQQIIVDHDTLIQVSIVKSITSEFYESEIEASFLLKKENHRIDTLLMILPKIEDFELPPNFENPQKFDLSEILSEIKYGKSGPHEIDSTRYQYWAITQIKHIKEGVFLITHNNSSYTGGAHGYGTEHYSYYDYSTNQKFTFEDVFYPKAWDIIYQEFILEMHIEKNETNFEDVPADYLFTLDALEFNCGMYGTIFGYGGGYLGCHFSIPYTKLKKYMIKGSPIWNIRN